MAIKSEIVLSAKDRTKAAFNSLKKNTNDANRAFSTLRNQVLALAGVGGFGALIQSNITLADQTGKTAQKLGLTTEALSGLRFAAEQTGVSTGTLDTALQRLVRRTAEAAQGTGEAKNAIAELGLDAQTLAAMSPDEQFKAIADAMQGVATQGDKVRLAMRLFDTEGVALVNTLEGGSTQLEEFKKQAGELGILIEEDTAKQAAEFNDTMNRIKRSVTGASLALVEELLPTLQRMGSAFEQAAKSDDFFGSLGEQLSNALFPTDIIINSRLNDINQKIIDAQTELRDLQTQRGGLGENAFFNILGFKSSAEIDQRAAELSNIILSAMREAEGLGGIATGGQVEPQTIEDSPTVQTEILKQTRAAEIRHEAWLEEEFSRQEHLDRMLDIETENAEKIRAMQVAENDARLGLAQSGFGALASLAQQGGEKYFKVYQALALAETWVSTYQAAQNAYANQLKIGDPYTAMTRASIAAGIAYTAGAARAAAILKQSPSGSGGGGGANGGAIPPLPTESSAGGAQTSVFILGNTSATSAQQLLDQLEEEINNGDRVIMDTDSRQVQNIIEASRT